MGKLALLLFALVCFPTFAQFTSSVQGTITDPAGAAVGGAVVTLTNTDTNIAAVFTTQESGQYTFNILAPGSYTVTVEAKGFDKSVNSVVLTTQQTVGLNVPLVIGQSTTTVNVASVGGHELNPDETRLQYTLSAREIEEFPLQNRATLGLLRSAPGATGIDEGHLNVQINRDTASESVGGRGTASNVFLLDFIPIASQLAGTGGSGTSTGYINLIPHPDMIQEIALQSTTFAVENGAGSGIQTSITTKSGANKFHGDVDYTYAAGSWKANTGGSTTKPSARNQYVSAALGGPIWKDHTFFFGSYLNQQVGSSGGGIAGFYDPAFIAWGLANYPNSQNISRGLVPYPADRAVPGTGKVVTRGKDLNGFNFVNFSNPACDSAPASSNLVPVPCDLPIYDNAFYNAPSFTNGFQYNFRLDHSLREGKDRIYASFFRFDQKSNSQRIQSTFGGVTPSTGYYIAGNYTHTFTPTLLNQASFGQTRFFFNYGIAPGAESQLLLPYLSGCTCAGLNQIQFLERNVEHQSYGRDSVSWIKGKHNLTFGFQGAYNNELQDQSQVYGRPFFQAAFFYLDYLNDLSDLELIYTLSANTSNNPGKFIPQLFGAGSTRFGLYAQDAWKVSPNLVLNYGLRWDDFGNPSEYGKNAEQYSNVRLGSGSALQDRVAGLSVALVNDVYSGRRNSNFLPRGGFAYTLPYANRSIVLHGGVGLYEDDLNLSDVSSNLPTQPPVRLSLSLGQFSTPKAVNSFGTTTVQGSPGGNPYGFQFPNVPIYGYNSAGAPVDAKGNVQLSDLHGVDPNLKPQSSILYNFGFEEEFPRRFIFGMLYSGSNSHNQLVTSDVNTYAGAYNADNSVKGPLYSPNFQRIKFFRNAGNSNYNALIVTGRQTIGRLTYQASYTWGKALGDPTNFWTDQYNIHSQYSYQNSDIRNRFTLTQVYEIPTAFDNKVLNEALAGWSISNSVVVQSGSPFTAAPSTSGAFDFNQDGTFYDLPAYVGRKRVFSNGDARRAFFSGQSVFGDVASKTQPQFVAPTGLTEGDRQNNFFGPNYFDWDAGLSKKFDLPWFLGERSSLALRGEFINLVNHANYNNPNASSFDSLSQVGLVTGVHQPRIIQIGGRFQF